MTSGDEGGHHAGFFVPPFHWLRIPVSGKICFVKLADVPQIEKLSTREKLAFIDEIWCAVACELDQLDLTPEEQQLLDQRWNSYEKGEQPALSLQEFRARIDTLRK